MRGGAGGTIIMKNEDLAKKLAAKFKGRVPLKNMPAKKC